VRREELISRRWYLCARQIADNMPLYVFPTRTGNPIGLGNNRQADIKEGRRDVDAPPLLVRALNFYV
jgi:hypothetical protein